MGGILNNLTKPGLQASDGGVQYYDSPAERSVAFAQQRQVPTDTPMLTGKVPLLDDATGEPLPSNTGVATMPQSTPTPPKFLQPSFQQATTNATTGMPNPAATNPALTKKGALFQILGQAAMGGMAGQAASAQAVQASGGHRGGSVGQGFMAGVQEPYQQAAMKQQITHGGLENQAIQQQNAMLPWLMKNKQEQAAAELKNTEATTRLHNVQADVAGLKEHPADKAIQDYVGGDGKQHIVFQQPNGETYEKTFGDVNQKDPKEPNRDDKAIAIMAKPESTWTPEEQAYMKGYKEYVNLNKVQPGVIRAAEFGETRGMPVTDKKTGVTAPMSWADYNKLSKAEPGRWVSPQFDVPTQTEITVAKAGASDFAKGKGADQKQSFGTFVGHAGDLSDAVNGIRLAGSPLINKPWNWIQKNAAGDPLIQAYIAKVDPVRKEFATFLLNNHALSEQDKTEAAKILDESLSPAQMQATIKSFAHTAAIRMGQLNERYKNSHNGQNDATLMSGDTAQILTDLGQGDFVQKFRNGLVGTPAKSSGKGNRPPLSSFER